MLDVTTRGVKLLVDLLRSAKESQLLTGEVRDDQFLPFVEQEVLSP